jgi:hypothetical protein
MSKDGARWMTKGVDSPSIFVLDDVPSFCYHGFIMEPLWS